MLPEIKPGTLINNRYLINKLLGQGGFGRTYLAADTQRFNEECVLKEFVPGTTKQEILAKSKELFEREAKVLYKIQHPQIPKFLATVTDNKRLFIVQEYINGKNYSQILFERLTQTRRPFSEAETKTWLLGILPILEYLHNLKIIHRDISLENVMSPQNQSLPVLIDFGVVKEKVTQFFSDNNSDNFSPSASVVGKVGYSPPEQLRFGQCFPSSDLYALAVCAIVLLTGQMPYSLVDESLQWNWRRKVNISNSFACILEKMLAETPSARYQSAKEVIIEINTQTNAIYSSNSLQQENDLPTKLHPQTPISLNTEFIEYCKHELTSFVGPLASVLIERTLDKNPYITPDEFIDVISNAIPNRLGAQEFKQRFNIGIQTYINQLKNSVKSQQAPVNQPAISNPEFLKSCQQELISFVGPIASVVLNNALTKYPDLTPNQLIETLIAEIPNKKTAKQFKERIYELKII